MVPVEEAGEKKQKRAALGFPCVTLELYCFVEFGWQCAFFFSPLVKYPALSQNIACFQAAII